MFFPQISQKTQILKTIFCENLRNQREILNLSYHSGYTKKVICILTKQNGNCIFV